MTQTDAKRRVRGPFRSFLTMIAGMFSTWRWSVALRRRERAVAVMNKWSRRADKCLTTMVNDRHELQRESCRGRRPEVPEAVRMSEHDDLIRETERRQRGVFIVPGSQSKN